MSRCGKRTESFTLTRCWETSALDDGFKTLCFEVLARAGGGLRISVRPDLNAIIFVRGRIDNEGGKFFLLQSLREGHGVTLAYDCRDLEHDGSLRNQRGPRRSGIFWRRHGVCGGGGKFPARRAALAGEWRGGFRCRDYLLRRLQMVFGWFWVGGMIKIPIGIFWRRRRRVRAFRLCFRLERRRGNSRIVLERFADRRAEARIVLATTEQVNEREDNSENHDEQHEQPNQVPALQDKIAAAFFFSRGHLSCGLHTSLEPFSVKIQPT